MRKLQVFRKIALIDWDGTIRKDFTIRSWIKFLADHGTLAQQAVEDIEEVFALLFKGSISHDESSRRTTAIYAFYIKGHSKTEITKLASLFFEEDSQYLCSFSQALLSCLARSSIQVVVISGAPVEILLEYQRIFSIERVYALELQTVDGIFVDEVLANHGTTHEKRLIIDHLLTSQMYEIVLSAGNSSSDLPLLEAAPASIIVDNPNLRIIGKSLYLSCNEANIGRMLTFLQREVDCEF